LVNSSTGHLSLSVLASLALPSASRALNALLPARIALWNFATTSALFFA